MRKKRQKQRRRTKKFLQSSLFTVLKARLNRGSSPYPILLLGIIILSIVIAGILRPPLAPTQTLVNTVAACCDTGNGPNCRPQTGSGQVITYNGKQYGLIRSTVKFAEGNLHLQDTGVKVGTAQYSVIVNSTQNHAVDIPEVNSACNRPDPVGQPKDLYWKTNPSDPYMFMKPGWTVSEAQTYCTSIPDNELIFVCKDHCHPAACSFPTNDPTVKCYGDNTSIYDIYFRLSDVDANGNPNIPDFIKNCDKSNLLKQVPSQQVAQLSMVPPNINQSPNNMKSLQLKNFNFTYNPNITIPWFSPLCKPAIYLYPPKKESIHVQIAPKGTLTYTDPLYPANGWDVIADPNGNIEYQNKQYDYLFYEAKIPDSLLSEQETGYVVTPDDLKTFFNQILPQLGFNKKEQQQFSDYWLKSLPTNTPYYKVSLIPQTTIDTIAPLTIIPKPDTIQRVDMNFEPFANKISLTPPVLESFKRIGFTVFEWGGMYKQGKNHPFTCLM